MINNGLSGSKLAHGYRKRSNSHAEQVRLALRLRQYLVDLLVGAPLASNAQAERKLGVFTGLPVFGLDGLSSSAYGPEAPRAIMCITPVPRCRRKTTGALLKLLARRGIDGLVGGGYN
jgi:hypothetical protein